MSERERVVIRSSWLATLLNFAPVALALLVVEIWQRSLGGTVFMLVITVVITGSFRYLNYVELTSEALGIHWFRMERLPWQRIGSVDRVSGLGSHELKIFDLAFNTGRRLPAPRGAFGAGRKETTEARDLIETWWLAHGGTLHQTPARSAAPGDGSGRPADPWAPPPSGPDNTGGARPA
jgi:hypothetical protein